MMRQNDTYIHIDWSARIRNHIGGNFYNERIVKRLDELKIPRRNVFNSWFCLFLESKIRRLALQIKHGVLDGVRCQQSCAPQQGTKPANNNASAGDGEQESSCHFFGHPTGNKAVIVKPISASCSSSARVMSRTRMNSKCTSHIYFSLFSEK